MQTPEQETVYKSQNGNAQGSKWPLYTIFLGTTSVCGL